MASGEPNDGVTVHVLPTGGGSARDDSPWAYRNLSVAGERIQRAYLASALAIHSVEARHASEVRRLNLNSLQCPHSCLPLQ